MWTDRDSHGGSRHHSQDSEHTKSPFPGQAVVFVFREAEMLPSRFLLFPLNLAGGQLISAEQEPWDTSPLPLLTLPRPLAIRDNVAPPALSLVAAGPFAVGKVNMLAALSFCCQVTEDFSLGVTTRSMADGTR